MQNQQYYSQNQQPTHLRQPVPYAVDDRFQQRALTQMRIISIIQVVCGILCMTFGIVLITIPAEINDYGHYYGDVGVSRVGAGIWIGFYYALVGAAGIAAVKSNTGCWIIAAMIVNIISSVLFCFFLFIISIIGISFSSPEICLNSRCNSNRSYYLAMNCFLLVLSIAQFIIAIWSAVLCCGAVCRCFKPAVIRQNIQYSVPTAYQWPVEVQGGAYPQQQPVNQVQPPTIHQP